MRPMYTTHDIWKAESAKLAPGETLDAETVARWCQAGVFPHAIREGKIWRIPAEDYDPVTFVRPAPGRPDASFEEGWVSVSQAAEIAQVATATVRKWIYDEKLKAEGRVNGYAIRREDLEQYLKSR